MKQKLELEQLTNEQLRLAKEEVNNADMLMSVSSDVAEWYWHVNVRWCS